MRVRVEVWSLGRGPGRSRTVVLAIDGAVASRDFAAIDVAVVLRNSFLVESCFCVLGGEVPWLLASTYRPVPSRLCRAQTLGGNYLLDLADHRSTRHNAPFPVAPPGPRSDRPLTTLDAYKLPAYWTVLGRSPQSAPRHLPLAYELAAWCSPSFGAFQLHLLCARARGREHR